MLIETSGLSFVDISYEFDFDSEKTLDKFNEIYKGKFIKDTEQLKKDYPNFFDIKMDAESYLKAAEAGQIPEDKQNLLTAAVEEKMKSPEIAAAIENEVKAQKESLIQENMQIIIRHCFPPF